MAFDNLGPLVLGHPPLPLEPQIICRAAAQLPVEAHHFDTHALAFIHSEDLIGVCAS
jgi:hypothetical protein